MLLIFNWKHMRSNILHSTQVNYQKLKRGLWRGGKSFALMAAYSFVTQKMAKTNIIHNQVNYQNSRQTISRYQPLWSCLKLKIFAKPPCASPLMQFAQAITYLSPAPDPDPLNKIVTSSFCTCLSKTF